MLTKDWSVEAVHGLVQRLYGITKEEQAFIASMIKSDGVKVGGNGNDREI